MSQDIISDCLNNIMNAKKAKKQELEVSRYSKLLLKVLDIAKKEEYLDYHLDEKNKKLRIRIKDLSECRSIKPRFFVKVDEIEKYSRRFLPARNVGIMIISTSKGVITKDKAEEDNLGGSLLAYFY